MRYVCIVDVGSGNLGSLKSVFKKLNQEIRIINNSEDLNENEVSKIILPGMGSFPNFIDNLSKKKFDIKLKYLVLKKKIEILGICVGFQALFEKSFEIKKTNGLGLLKGNVKKISIQKNLKLPHIGWNNCIINDSTSSKLFNNIKNNSDFYFCHSFAAYDVETQFENCKTFYSEYFTSAISKDNIFGVQFHPEKSQLNGIKLIQNFLLK